AAPPAAAEPRRGALADWILPALVLVAVLVLYYPPANALAGPRLEEGIHLNALHRMRTGDIPYRDFEFLYGPLMLYPAYWWTEIAGWSLPAYYAYIAFLEALVLLALVAVIQRHVTGFWPRLGAFLLLSGFYFNALLGPNQNGLRKLAGVLVLLWLAHRPMARGRWLGAGVAIGLLLAYSQEFGAATAVGVAALYLALAGKGRDWRPLGALAAIGAVSALVWLGTLWLILGAAVGDYFAAIAYLTRRFDAGEAAFPYYWTVSGLAVFGLIALACLQGGRILAARWPREGAGAGDLFLIAALAYAALLLKSGLNRSDQWHLVPTVLPIAFAVTLPLAFRVVPLTRALRRTGLGLVLVLALAYSFGQLPIARYVFREGLVDGYRMLLSGRRHGEEIAGAPFRPLMLDTGDPAPDRLALARFLASGEMRGRPVFIYARNWSLPYQAGLRRVGYLADDYIYGDDRGAGMRAALEADPSVLVIMRREEFDWMTGARSDLPVPPFNLGGWGLWRTVRAYVSSTHIPAVPVEEAQKTARWRRLVGDWIIARYRPVYLTDRYAVLARGEGT
ncbi:hypothetical protein, partial [Albidovulum sp.]